MLVAFAAPACNLISTSQVETVNASVPPWKTWGVLGEQRLVVICTEFSDVTHSVNKQTIENRLNNMAKYFEDISFSKVDINITFFGDHWERLNNTMAYYGNGSYSEDNRSLQFIADSLKAWKGYVNFSNYDYVIIIHAGEDQSSNINETELLWRQSFFHYGHSEKRNFTVDGVRYSFWGVAYDSEFEEWGLIAHEMGHNLGLPNLYIVNETQPMDKLSLMASGDRNGLPEGTLPASIEGFGMFMLGWAQPQETSLNVTENFLVMIPLEYSSPSLLRINLTESTYYLVEIREKTGYDEDAVDSTKLVVWLIDENRPSGNGPAVVCSSGKLSEGQIYSDKPNEVFIKFISFNSTTHKAYVGLSSNMLFVDLDFPDSVQASSINGTIRIYDSNNNPAQNFDFNMFVDNSAFSQSTDEKGEANVNIGELNPGLHTIQVLSPQFLAGELETTIQVIAPEGAVPWNTIAVIAIAVMVIVIVIVILLILSTKRR